jgi:hypothetical protein
MLVSLRAGWLDSSVVGEVVFVVLALLLPVEVEGGSPDIFQSIRLDPFDFCLSQFFSVFNVLSFRRRLGS